MSRKHFVVVAATLRLQLEAAISEEAKRAVRETIRALAVDFCDFNPNFDRNRFLAACGL
jgi:hypothetical protein